MANTSCCTLSTEGTEFLHRATFRSSSAKDICNWPNLGCNLRGHLQRCQMPDIENSRKTAEKGAEWVTVKQPKNSRKNSRNTRKTAEKQSKQLFFGCFGCFSGCFLPYRRTHSAPFSAVFRLFSMSGIWHLCRWPRRLQNLGFALWETSFETESWGRIIGQLCHTIVPKESGPEQCTLHSSPLKIHLKKGQPRNQVRRFTLHSCRATLLAIWLCKLQPRCRLNGPYAIGPSERE